MCTAIMKWLKVGLTVSCVYGGSLLSDPMTYVYSAGFTNKYECVLPSALRPRLYTSDRFLLYTLLQLMQHFLNELMQLLQLIPQNSYSRAGGSSSAATVFAGPVFLKVK